MHEQIEVVSVAFTSDELSPEAVACSLGSDDLRARRALIVETLLPHVLGTTALDSGLLVLFADGDAVRAQVEAFASLERQCCGFLSFSVTPADDGLRLAIEGPAEAQATLESFAALMAGA